MAARSEELYRRMSGRPALTRGGRWATRAKAALLGGADQAQLAGALLDLQAPVARTRRVVVAAAHGGGGASTVAVCLAEAIRIHRRDGVALVDAAASRPGLAARVPTTPDMSVDRAMRQALRSATLPARHTASEGASLVFAPAAAGRQAPETLAAALAGQVAFVVLDTASDPWPDCGDAVVLCAENTVRGLAALHLSLRSHDAAGPRTGGTALVVLEREADSGVTRRDYGRELGRYGVPVLPLPRDRHLAGAAQIHVSLLAPATRVAAVRLAGEVVRVSRAR